MISIRLWGEYYHCYDRVGIPIVDEPSGLEQSPALNARAPGMFLVLDNADHEHYRNDRVCCGVFAQSLVPFSCAVRR